MIDEVPKWQGENEFLLSGYRAGYEGICEVTESLCQCHNETVNVWTHLFGMVTTLTLGILIMFFFKNTENIGYQGLYTFKSIKKDIYDQEGFSGLSNYIMEKLDL